MGTQDWAIPARESHVSRDISIGFVMIGEIKSGSFRQAESARAGG
jgi:hypothetical protein